MTAEVLTFENRLKWKQWLAKNHNTSRGLWLSLRKIGSPHPGVTYPEALDIALCYGWIDGQKKRSNEQTFLQRFVPRAKKSIWSKVNQGHVRRLIEAGEMQAAGLAEIERAKRDGRWDAAYEPQSRANVPEDFQAALDANPAAKEFFAQLDSKNRYAILFRLQLPKRAETRSRKIQEFVKMLTEERTFH